MGTESIIVLIAVALLFAYLIIDVIMTIKKRSSPSPITFILLIIGVLFLILMIYRGQELKAPDLAQILLMIGLVTITAVYAWSTRRQANASVKMAEEMREQRVTASRPIIIQKAVYEKDIYEGSTKDYFSHFEISNVGNGPAIEVEISLTEKEGGQSHSIRQTFLRTDDPPIKFRPYNIANLEESKTYYLVCEYQSIFSISLQKTLYRTRLPFKPAKSSEEGKIYLVAGELEFSEVSEKERIDAFSSRSKPK